MKVANLDSSYITKLPQAVLDKLARSVTPHPNLSFWGYYSSMWAWWYCKESAGITIPTIDDKQYLIVYSLENIIQEFKRLSNMFDIDAEVSSFTAKVNGKDYVLYHVTGWFDQNVLTREMGRFLLRQAQYTIDNSHPPIRSISEFIRYHYLSNYVSSPPLQSDVGRFLENLKKNVEAVDISRLNYNVETGSGFIRWIQNGFLTF